MGARGAENLSAKKVHLPSVVKLESMSTLALTIGENAQISKLNVLKNGQQYETKRKSTKSHH